MMSVFAQRRKELIHRMNMQGIEGALIVNPSSLYYLTGFLSNPHERFLGLFLFADGSEALVVPALEKEEAESHFQPVLSYSDSEGPIKSMQKLVAETRRIKKLGVEKEALNLERAEWLKEMVPDLQFHSISPLIQKMRAVKSQEEIDFLRKAAQMVDQVVKEGISRIKRGMTEIELVNELEWIAKRLGSPHMAFDTMVLSGPKSAAPHGKPDHSIIRENEFLLLDLGVSYKGYYSDITRTFMVGEGTLKHKEIYELVLSAQTAAIQHVRPGVSLAELDRIARDIITNGGYGEFFTHRLGHGLGLEVHEYPSVHGQNHDVLIPDLVFTIEPGIYLPGFGGVRIEDDVVVTANGAEVLTQSPKDWESSIIFIA
jgi:Xaa-Pro dipeptidase